MQRRPGSPLYFEFLFMLIGALFISFIPGPAAAVTYELTAQPGASFVTTFTITYSDDDNSGFFNPAPGHDTMINFSGVKIYGVEYQNVIASPDNLAAYSDGTGSFGRVVDSNSWLFSSSLYPAWPPRSCRYDAWTYTHSGTPLPPGAIPSGVPLPPSAILLGSGLMCLILARRRKRLR
jgi:hypothetical protein